MRTNIITCLAGLVLGTILWMPRTVTASEISSADAIHVGVDKQLLFDNYFLAKSEGVRLQMNRPYQDHQPVVTSDKPWEKNIVLYNTVMFDEGKFRMWYDVIDMENDPIYGRYRFLCYAESADGLHWIKPELGLIELYGNKQNNIVTPADAEHAMMQGATVFRDDHAPAAERYKLWTPFRPAAKDENKKIETKGTYTMFSRDGIHWGEPRAVKKSGFANDSQNIVFWDKDIKKYVAFVRKKEVPKSGPRGRTCWVGLTYSDDFVNWTKSQDIFFANEKIPVPGGEPEHTPVVDLYTPGGMKYPGVSNAYILLCTPFYHWGKKGGFPATIDVTLATSRDREHWWQPEDPEAYLRLGPDGTPDSGMIFANPWPIVVGDEIWIYYGGVNHDHAAPGNPSRDKGGVFVAKIRRDGFISVDAGQKGGEFTTPSMVFEGGRLEVNLDGSAGGWLQVKIQDAAGSPIEGFSLNRADTIRGNNVAKAITWNGSSDVSSLAGKEIRLHFVMRSMKLYAFQFVR
jgi:hypothetical protein